MKQILYVIALLLSLTFAAGCHHSEQRPTAVSAQDSTEVPGMATSNVTMLISDSGVIRYRVSSKTWLRYNMDPKNEYQYFPDGLLLENIDSLGNILGSITCDTAYNYERQELWHLIKNVRIENSNNEHFFTHDLYWDMRSKKVYSDSFIHIERPDAIIEGIGFTSNDDFSRYEVRQTSGIFPVKEQ